MIMQTPDTQPLRAGDTVNAVATQAQRRRADNNRVHQSDDRLAQLARAAGDTARGDRHRDPRDDLSAVGAVLVFDTADGRSALLRSGGPQWRYQFPKPDSAGTGLGAKTAAFLFLKPRVPDSLRSSDWTERRAMSEYGSHYPTAPIWP